MTNLSGTNLNSGAAVGPQGEGRERPSRFPKYPKYKDSSNEWIGDIPNHWSANPLKRAFKIEGGSTPTPDEANWDGDIAWVTPADLSGLSTLFLDASKRTITATGLESCGTTLLPAGSLILSTRAPIGSLAIALTRMCTNQGCKGLVPNADVSSTYFAYVLLTAKAELNNRGKGTTFLEISGDELGRFVVPTPPFPEQTQIARFLDHETARIDALIEEQQRLIELLKEKRQAVISHAVTKGLDPTVPMKDSGVEWLGEVPAHWVVSQLKFNTLEMQTGPFGSQLHAEDYIDGGIPLVNPAHMINGKIIPEPQVSVDKATWERLKRHALSPGEIIFARRGELGRCAIVTNEQSGWLCGTGSLKARLSSKLVAEYAYLLITSRGAVAELSLESKGSTMENLNTETLGRIRLPLPPVSEQKAILEYVHDVAGQFEALVGAAETGIRLMAERRSALISAAVTGKIDVRNWQPPASVQAPEVEQEAV